MLGVALTFEEGGHVSQLRDVVLRVATLLLQLLQPVQELSAGVGGVDAAQGLVHLSPVPMIKQWMSNWGTWLHSRQCCSLVCCSGRVYCM